MLVKDYNENANEHPRNRTGKQVMAAQVAASDADRDSYHDGEFLLDSVATPTNLKPKTL